MNLGDVVVLDGRSFHVCGVDPVSVRPRFAYLQAARTGRAISVPFERASASAAWDPSSTWPVWQEPVYATRWLAVCEEQEPFSSA
jgi:hypothetical protein